VAAYAVIPLLNHYRLLNFICSHYQLSTTHILAYNNLLFYVFLIILIFVNFSAISNLPEDGAEAPKYVGAFCNDNLIF
jgi:hypothetical protein